MYDFVVVGAGPAGSRFAWRAATAGRDVLVLERGAVGRPLACSGHVSTDLWEFVPDGAREELLQNEVSGARFHAGGPGSDSHLFYSREAISNVVDRVALDRTLAAAAREAGAEVREHHRVVGVDEHAGGEGSAGESGSTDGGESPNGHVAVEARTPEGSGTETFRARMVAGCDGPVSRVRRELDLPEPGELLGGVLAFTEAEDAGEHVDVHLTVPDFFAWRIPRGAAGVEYGLAAAPGSDARELFADFTDDYGVGVETNDVCAGTIPIGPPERVTGARSFLVGDAAGQTKPFTGGGIVYGMTAADHAASEIDPRDPRTLADYERAWRANLAREIRLGRWVRRAYSLPGPIQRAGLALLSGEIGVHMDRPTTLFSPAHLRKLLS
ncbi:electron transfer flavoprotein [Halobacteriales archaeon QS_4_69_34]|nr:MAG: electron transfer flavoprotein [Halobacteriales archaeon QS_4_69_34]